MKKSAITYIMLIIVLGVAAVLSLKLFFRQRAEHDLLDIHKFPYVIGKWQGKDLEITAKEYAILETRNLILREYINPEQEKIYLFIIYSETNRSVFHPPEVCMIGSGLNIMDKTQEKINIQDNSFFTNKLYAGRDKPNQIIFYTYKVGRLYTDNFYLHQLYFIFNQLFSKDKSGATIRVSMPLTKSESYTTETLKEFLQQTIQRLEELVN